MTTAEPNVPERRQRTVHLINELQTERRDLWNLYCEMANLKPFSDVSSVTAKLMQFSEVLVDYMSLGHFGLYERILSGTERRQSIMDFATEIYPDFSSVTEIAVAFNDKYEKTGKGAALTELTNDLSALGEWLAIRFDLEDQLCELMRR